MSTTTMLLVAFVMGFFQGDDSSFRDVNIRVTYDCTHHFIEEAKGVKPQLTINMKSKQLKLELLSTNEELEYLNRLYPLSLCRLLHLKTNLKIQSASVLNGDKKTGQAVAFKDNEVDVEGPFSSVSYLDYRKMEWKDVHKTLFAGSYRLVPTDRLIVDVEQFPKNTDLDIERTRFWVLLRPWHYDDMANEYTIKFKIPINVETKTLTPTNYKLTHDMFDGLTTYTYDQNNSNVFHLATLDPGKERRRDILLFVLAALFGVGVSVVFEGLLAKP